MNLNLTVATRYGLNILGLLGVSVALYLGSSIFIPLVISALLATILFPAAKWLHARVRVPWFFACLSTILLLVLLSGLVISAIGVSVASLVYQLPQDEPAWKEKYDTTVERLRRDMPFITQEVLPTTYTHDTFGRRVPDPNGENAFRAIVRAFSVDSLTPYLMKLLGAGGELLGETVLILFVILFLLLEAELLGRKVRALFGTSSENERRVGHALGEMAEAIRTYLVWRTIINLGLAVVLGVFYRYVARLEHWYLWAVLTAILNYVPYIGTMAAGLPPVVDALLFTGTPAQSALGIIVFYTVLVTLEGYLIVPWVMGRSMDLNATTVMLACLYWHLVWGISGLFLAMPLMAAIKAVMLHVDGWQPWGELLSSVETTPAAPAESVSRAAEIAKKAERNSEATIIMDDPELPPRPGRKG
jgi:predicted PurR-regulated permease PerM